MDERGYRFEQKYLISLQTAVSLRQSLGALLHADAHAIGGRYHIRSLYFDDPANSAYFDKVSGVDERVKFRIRHYNFDPSYLLLEKKEKRGSLTRKASARIDAETARRLADGSFCAAPSDPPLLQEFYALQRGCLLCPVVYVDYERFPFVYPDSHTRITIDAAVSAGRPDAPLFGRTDGRFPVLPDGSAILEIKYDEQLPAHALALMASVPMQLQAVSKYCLCRALLG